MNTFLRKAVYLSLAIIVFNFVIAFIGTFGAFPVEGTPGTGAVKETDFLTVFTGLDDPDMSNLWLLAIGVGTAIGIVFSIFTHSVVPIGIAVFSEVFWTSWMSANSVLSTGMGTGSFIPPEFLGIFFIGMIFLFIAAVVGMLTGSG